MEKRKAPQEPERECCLVLALRRNRTLIPQIEGTPSIKREMIQTILSSPSARRIKDLSKVLLRGYSPFQILPFWKDADDDRDHSFLTAWFGLYF